MAIPAISLPTVTTTITATSSFNKLNKTPPKPFNTNLKSLTKSGKLNDALLLLESQKNSQPENKESYLNLLHACISQKSLEHGHRLYLHLLLNPNRSKFLNDPLILSKLITLFSVCDQLDEARRVFEHHALETEDQPESVWVAMAIGYSKKGFFREALLIYCQMLFKSIEPGNFAFSMAVKACSGLSDLRVGRGVHAQIIKADKEPDQVVYNAILGMYSECGCFEDVLKVFEEMPDRNVVSWNSLIAGFVKKGEIFEAFETFRRMQRDGVGYGWVTFTTILAVCSQVTYLYYGREVHSQIVKSTKVPDLVLVNSLLDMYAKCGAMEYCRRVFERMKYKDITSWNTVINGYAINGLMEEAMKLFDDMVGSGVRPDGVTFITLLSGCSHAGLANLGEELFENMSPEFGIRPSSEHYACLVDILGRAGKIKEALQVVEKMPVKPSGSIWGSLLNSCRLHGNVSLAELVAEQLFEMEPNNCGNYVILSNIYANAGLWEGVKKVREMMENKGIKKEAGCSWIQVRNRVHTFMAGGGFEFRNSDEYKEVWDELSDAIEKMGYKPDTRVVLHDVNEETKAEWICGHSERLATVFGLIHTGSGIPIRVTKNLRICADCHSWMKFVSEITRRKIIVRDTNRFHHFDKGICSCNDYW
ncbi:pentatricopeptide repeat-containing protein At3g14330-like [Nicotiana sylvestris]|uniref:Pentatricopeptide repeat-containing protein At3g14330-like n=1 Tax=Nicotiana sylvestris TaxID=4096 RepID=A0A1U7V8K4_NICSY|nr:PREDICTED: pentatricopeptide repeat-containing protein At3g14330-like [Nicotiana sylvestris]